MRIFLTLLAIFLPFSAMAAQSETVDLGESRASLVSSVDSLNEGEPIVLGVRIELAPGWHTYTYNPGDAGIPFGAEWNLPEGASASETYWPPYQQFDEAGLTTYGYSEEVVFTHNINVGDVSESNVIKAKAEYLVCKEVCIPQTAELSLTLPKGDVAPSAEAQMLGDWQAKSKLENDWGDVKKNALVGSHAGTEHADIAEETCDSTAGHPATPPAPQRPLYIYLLFALLGGLILNLMPCVFPVLSLKALAIAKHAQTEPKAVREEGIAYTLGILTCFLALGGALSLLGQLGGGIGWGFQFQSPGFVALMALLLFFIGLNLSGLFELPTLLGGLAGSIGSESSARNSYLTGLLAALVATPCTAPFMAPALGFALTQTAGTALLVFAFLALGLALPFLLISFVPQLRRFLPKPGAWMESFKHFLAFPMFLSAIWLLWVLGTQTGMESIIAVMIFATIIIFLMWAKSRCGFKSHFCTIANLFIVAAMLALLVEAVGNMQTSYSTTPTAVKERDISYTPQNLADLRAAGTPVFVDATASWCITCKVNYKVGISDARVQQAFKDRGIVYMVADWTNRNDEITHYLTSFGFKGVPLYVYYAPGEEGKVLPQLLTPDLILENIAPSI